MCAAEKVGCGGCFFICPIAVRSLKKNLMCVQFCNATNQNVIQNGNVDIRFAGWFRYRKFQICIWSCQKNGNHVSSYVGSLWKIAEYLKSIYEGFKYHNELVRAFFLEYLRCISNIWCLSRRNVVQAYLVLAERKILCP